MAARWKVKLDRDRRDFELSVVVIGCHGDKSWGWSGEDKIMLLSGVLNEDYTKETLERVKKYAVMLCAELNGE